MIAKKGADKKMKQREADKKMKDNLKISAPAPSKVMALKMVSSPHNMRTKTLLGNTPANVVNLDFTSNSNAGLVPKESSYASLTAANEPRNKPTATMSSTIEGLINDFANELNSPYPSLNSLSELLVKTE